MPINKWKSKAVCGEEASEGCEALDEVTYGKFPVIVGNDNCQKGLVSEKYPGIPYAESVKKTEIRTGAKEKPLTFPLLQETTGTSILSIVTKKSDGQLAAWKPVVQCYDRRVVHKATGFELVEDINSNVFHNACIGTISDVDYVAGAVSYDNCDGDTRMRLVFFPKDEVCSTCS
jgi:hypothetical protein